VSGGHPRAIVVGGGPGGASAAALLASWGHEVALVTRPSPPAGWLAESIPASTWRLLDAVGVREPIESAGFFSNGGNTVWWAGRPERSEAFPGGTAGVHVQRVTLEEVLLSAAEKQGVIVHRDGPVRAVERVGRSWRVEWGSLRLETPWIVDGSGRAGILARRTRIEDRPTGTIALVGRWYREGGWPEDGTHTLIESHEDGWAWSVPISREVRCVTAMVDPRETDLERTGDIDAMLVAEIAKAPRLLARLDGATRESGARACPASLYTSESFTGDHSLLVGDAGSCIDPLSSFGVKKALASAWLAAVALNTALTDDSMAATALEFFDSREHEVYRRYRELSVPFFEEAAAKYGTPFWEARATAARRAAGLASGLQIEGEPGDPADRLDPSTESDALIGHRDVREAYEELRRRPDVGLAPGDSLDRIDLPVIRGNRIVLDAHLTSLRVSRGVRYIRNVDLMRIVHVAPGRNQVPEIFEAYNEGGPSAELTDFLAALAVALGKGFLQLQDWRPTARIRTISG